MSGDEKTGGQPKQPSHTMAEMLEHETAHLRSGLFPNANARHGESDHNCGLSNCRASPATAEAIRATEGFIERGRV